MKNYIVIAVLAGICAMANTAYADTTVSKQCQGYVETAKPWHTPSPNDCAVLYKGDNAKYQTCVEQRCEVFRHASSGR